MRKERVLAILQQLAPPGAAQGVSAEEVARGAQLQRHNVSADLNQLCREGHARKTQGRPVRFWASTAAPAKREAVPVRASGASDGMDSLVGVHGNLREAIAQAKAAMLYPPRGLATLIVGPTGAGKSRLAEAMYFYAVASGRLNRTAPFNVFNCADYASNPQLLLSQLFGHVKGAFTGAERESSGLVAEAKGGILFLDEIHRLPPDGQEMLFLLMDRSVYRPLGDTGAPRQASVTLIAATSEDPQSALLRTLLRRFPAVITLPALDSRPLDERLAMIEQFLAEEAARVGVPISISPLALVALLVFRTVGNVGELRSAVLLGCAKAFLEYVVTGGTAKVMPLFLTHLSPQIQLAYLSGGTNCREAERLVGVEDRLYAPDVRNSSVTRDDYVPADMYLLLRHRIEGYMQSGLKLRETQQLIRTDMDYYMRRLVRRGGDDGRLAKGLLAAVAAFVRRAGAELGRNFEQEVITGLALHLGSVRAADHAGADADRTLELIAHCPREYAVVRRLAPALEAGLGMALSSGEITFLALFLAARGRTAEGRAGLTVLVLAHGETTASSLADVANRILGTSHVFAVNMPLDQSVEETIQLAQQRIVAAGKTAGVALLVDMGSLTGVGPALAKATGMPVVVIPLVTTAAVIEAGRVADEPGADLNQLVRAVRQVLNPEATEPLSRDGKRVIVTTCLTGVGTARKLAAFLHEALPLDLREQIDIRPVDPEYGSQLPRLLVEGWRGSVVAAAGTVDPHLPGIPFIGMEQILFGEGVQRLVALVVGRHAEAEEEGIPSRREAMELATRFVVESIASVDGRQAAAAAAKALTLLEERLEQVSSPSQAARWVIHFAFALERLLTDGPVTTCTETAYLQEHHGGLLESIRQVTAPITEAWGVEMPSSEISFLALIILFT